MFEIKKGLRRFNIKKSKVSRFTFKTKSYTCVKIKSFK